MTPTPQIRNEHSYSRVSILARLVPAFSYAIPMLGAALGALLLMRVMEAMRMAESAGLAAVAGGMAEANLPVLVALYLAILVGLIGIVVMVTRSFVATATASRSAWFFLFSGGLAFIPLLFLWEAESLLIRAISGYAGGVVEVAASIQLYLTMTLVTAAAFAVILLGASLTPLRFVLRAKRKYAPILVLVLMEMVLIGAVVAFQVQTSWLHQVKFTERL